MKKNVFFFISPALRRALQPAMILLSGIIIGWMLGLITCGVINHNQILIIDCSINALIDAPELINEDINLN
jgi:hypothetical protein